MSEKDQEPRLPPPAFPPGQRRYVPRSATPRKGSVPAVRRMDSDEPIEPRYDPIERAFISPDEPLPERRPTIVPGLDRPALGVERALSLEATEAPPDDEDALDADRWTRPVGEGGRGAMEGAALDEARIRPPAVAERGIRHSAIAGRESAEGEVEDGPVGEAAIRGAGEEEGEIEEGEEGEVVGMDLDTHLGSHRRVAEAISKHDAHIVDLTDAVQRLGDALARHGEVALQTGPTMSPLDQSLRLLCSGYLAGRRTQSRPLAVRLSDEY